MSNMNGFGPWSPADEHDDDGIVCVILASIVIFDAAVFFMFGWWVCSMIGA